MAEPMSDLMQGSAPSLARQACASMQCTFSCWDGTPEAPSDPFAFEMNVLPVVAMRRGEPGDEPVARSLSWMTTRPTPGLDWEALAGGRFLEAFLGVSNFPGNLPDSDL